MALQLDARKFVAKLNSEDLARSNLYLVVFPSLGNSMNADGNVSATPNALELFDRGLSIAATAKRIYGAAKGKRIRGLLSDDTDEILGTITGEGLWSAERDLGMMVKAVNIPGSTLETDLVKTRRTPHHVVKGKTDDPVTMSFYLSPGHLERLLVNAWFKNIYESSSAEVDFYSAYVKDIKIYTFNRYGQPMTETTLHKAFPSKVGSVNLGYESANEVSSFDVDFVYEYHTTVNISTVNSTDISATNIGTAVGALGGRANQIDSILG